MDLEIQDVVSFHARHETTIRERHRAARDELGFDLPVPVFALRIYEASEILFGRERPTSARIAKFIGDLHVVDLYLAAAFAEGDPAARSCLERWHGPQLKSLRDAHDSPDLTATGPSSPLARFAGFCPLRMWLAMAAAVGAPAPTTRDASRLLTSAAPEIRSAVDLQPARVVAALERDDRLALALALVARLHPARACDVAGRTPRVFATMIASLARQTAAAVDEAFNAAHLDRRTRRQTWSELGQALGLKKPKRDIIGRRLLREACMRALVSDDPTRCPDPNLALASLDRFDGVDRAATHDHALTCWPCLNRLAAGASGAGSTGLPRPAETRSGPRWAAAILFITLLATGAWLLRPTVTSLVSRSTPMQPVTIDAAPGRAERAPTVAAVRPARSSQPTRESSRPAVLETTPALTTETAQRPARPMSSLQRAWCARHSRWHRPTSAPPCPQHRTRRPPSAPRPRWLCRTPGRRQVL